MHIDEFREIWLVDFQHSQEPGEKPTPHKLVAKEVRTGHEVYIEQEKLGRSGPPFSFGPDSLWVTYDAPAQLCCHLSLGWPLPTRILDLHAEFRCLTSGIDVPSGYDIAGACSHFQVDGLANLYTAMLPSISLGHALLRGRYTAAVARMEAVGVPIDVETLGRLHEGWERIQDRLIKQVDYAYRVYDGRKFNPRRWAQWVNRNGIHWPRTAPGRLALDLDTFRDIADFYPEVRPMKELRATLAQLRSTGLAVGRDGRNRCSLRPFAAKTGRNAPSTTKFIFGPATWLRGLIKPQEGMALAYVDYEQQEFGIAAALSGDLNMLEAYRSGDPYLAFAKQTGAVPADATKSSHRELRERFKHCALGVQYGMGPKSLAVRLGVAQSEAMGLLQMHKTTYSTYWRWSHKVLREGRKHGRLQSVFGWNINANAESNPRSLKNFPLQANGAEMLRLACCFLTERGIRVCAPVHDAILIEAPGQAIDDAVGVCQQEMERASEAVIPGFRLRTEAVVVRFPERYMDPRGEAMWSTLMGLLQDDNICCTPATLCCS